jgi:hypothetical protein
MNRKFRLTEEIIKLSESDTWDKAKLEWKLEYIYWSDDAQTCLCGHYPIKEICVLENQNNKNFIKIGNCCVKKFVGIKSDKIFQCLKRIKNNITSGLNAETIEYAFNKKWINKWEYDFSFDTARKKNLSSKQELKRIQINKKIISLLGKSGIDFNSK